MKVERMEMEKADRPWLFVPIYLRIVSIASMNNPWSCLEPPP